MYYVFFFLNITEQKHPHISNSLFIVCKQGVGHVFAENRQRFGDENISLT